MPNDNEIVVAGQVEDTASGLKQSAADAVAQPEHALTGAKGLVSAIPSDSLPPVKTPNVDDVTNTAGAVKNAITSRLPAGNAPATAWADAATNHELEALQRVEDRLRGENST